MVYFQAIIRFSGKPLGVLNFCNQIILTLGLSIGLLWTVLGPIPQGSAWASEPPAPAIETATDAPDPDADPCTDADAAQGWLDRSYSYLNERLCMPAAWFDGFFGDPRTLEENPVNTFFRVRNTLAWDEQGGIGGGVQVRANIALPRLSERVRLLVSRDEEVSGEGLTGLDDGDDKTRVGFRLILSDQLQGLTDADATIRLESGALNPRLSTRYVLRKPWGQHGLFRGTQTLFWERLDGLGTQSRLDLEYAPRFGRLFRWTTRGIYSESSTGVDWKSVFIAYQQLDEKTAIRADVGSFGETQASQAVEEYFVSARLRRQWLRPWLFVELQPERAWPWDEATQTRRADWRIKATLEIQFENNPAGHQRRWDIQR